MVKVGIVGGTGYTGVELMRLLAQHPEVELRCITSRGEAGTPVSALYPSLRGRVDLAFSVPDVDELKACDVVFFATPHGVAQSMAGELLVEGGPKIIDISADFRVKDIPTWEQWYGETHQCPEWVDKAVYGLPELNRDAIKDAQLIACPGCYPTSIELGFMPLLEAGLVDESRLIASSASGASGAGRTSKVDFCFSEVSDGFRAYAVGGHRHLPEIEQTLAEMSRQSAAPTLTFVPHLLPMVRGINSTLYGTLLDTSVDLQKLYEERYADEPFVDVLPAGQVPTTQSVKASNMCRLSVFRPQNRDTVVVLSVIDNLNKGASGQAVQCMNLLFGFPETLGVDQIPIMP